MIFSTIISLPYIACLIWGVYFACMNGRSREQKIFLELVILGGLYEFMHANLLYGQHSPLTLGIMTIMEDFSSLAGLNVMTVLLLTLKEKHFHRRIPMVMFFLSLAVAVSLVTIFIIAGEEEGGLLISGYSKNTESDYYKASWWIGTVVYLSLYGLLFLINLLYIVIHLIDNRKALSSTIREKRPLAAMDLLFIVAGVYLISAFSQIVLSQRQLVHAETILAIPAIINTLCILMAGYSIRRWGGSYFHFILHDMLSDTQVPSTAVKTLSEQIQEEAEAIDDGSHDNAPEINTELLERFELYMKEKKPYLHSDYSMEVAAEQLHTNRTYISFLVNKAYQKNFREYINEKRIEEAKQVMKASPEAILEEVAASSGFNNASQLTRKFKEITGMTPRQWQKRQE